MRLKRLVTLTGLSNFSAFAFEDLCLFDETMCEAVVVAVTKNDV